MNSYISLTVVVLTLVSVETLMPIASDCSPFSNGCSTPWEEGHYKDTFTPACDRHDACYKCGVTYGESRRRCDKQFYRNMKTICRRNFSIFEYISCKVAAKVYYLGTRVGGITNFEREPTPWCTPAVEACLQPL